MVPSGCLDDPRGLAVEEEEVVDPAVALLQGKLPYRDTEASAHIGLGRALNNSACCRQLRSMSIRALASRAR